MKATGVITAGLAESNGSLLPGIWRDSLHVTCGLTACTPGSAPGPTLGNEYGKTLPFYFRHILLISLYIFRSLSLLLLHGTSVNYSNIHFVTYVKTLNF